jgi:hypothetical protein
MAFDETRRLGQDMLAIPRAFGIQFVIPRSIVASSATRLVSSSPGVIAWIASLVVCLALVRSAYKIAVPASRQYLTALVGRGCWTGLAVTLAVSILLGWAVIRELARAREEARRSNVAPGLRNLELAINHEKRDREWYPERSEGR